MKKFNPIATLNKKILIRYFRKKLRPFIQTQLDNLNHNLDSQEKVIKEIVDAKAKTSLQPCLGISEIDFRYPKSYRP